MQLKVFYIDDEEGLCENFFDFFSSKDIEVITFTDPKMAIDQAKTSPPDLLFIDYRLPGTTGDKVVQCMAAAIPKFLITGDISVATEYKFSGIFTKPYNHEDIQGVLDGFLSRLEKQSA